MSSLTLSKPILYSRVKYQAPPWTVPFIKNLDLIPSERIVLSSLPTPLHFWNPPGYENFKCFIKRDDLSSFDLSGNKVRKLEFLMAKALSLGCDTVLTIGGIQSNHARATACCARQLGLEPHLILRTNAVDADPGLQGNLLLDRMVGAHLHLVSVGTYARVGSSALLQQLQEQLMEVGKQPYVIPVGGSDCVGVWGYIEAVNEIMAQKEEMGIEKFDHIIFACGSGGTAAGLALGCRLAGSGSRVHAVAVCDSADYFFAHIETVSSKLGVDLAEIGHPRDWCSISAGQGLGYAKSSPAELEYIYAVSSATGFIYKALHVSS